MPAWVSAGFGEYAKRLAREFTLELIELKPRPRVSTASVAQVLDAETPRILAACNGFRLIALDERGKAWSTREFAARLARWRDGGDDVAFVIGSADGLADEVKAKAHAVMALSAMTLPHGLARVVLAEQIYRATTLLAGHPYHRG
jgi:23S rRNA (pseudouridine1915-N3)-methyltransferase